MPNTQIPHWGSSKMQNSEVDLPKPSTSTLKRKAVPEEDEEESIQPIRKIHRTQPSRTEANLTKSSSATSKFTRPRAPPLGFSRSVRGNSAPPPQTTARPASKLSTAVRPKRTNVRGQISSAEENKAVDARRVAQELEIEQTKVSGLQANVDALSREVVAAREQELNRRTELIYASDELENLRKQHSLKITDLENDLQKKDRLLREAAEDLKACHDDLARECSTTDSLKNALNEERNARITLSAEINTFQIQNATLQAQLDASVQEKAGLNFELETLRNRTEEMANEAVENELVRRKLHNMVQELKGNIRVFCRVRPILSSDYSNGSQPSSSEELQLIRQDLHADIAFPDRRDHREITLLSSSESATGQERKEKYNFVFDRVFEPESTQAEVFEDVSMLAQSCVDGYNVCVFAYGQTGSGKSFTMEGGSTEATKGMIPRAVEQVFRVAEGLRSKGWEYKMEGQFLEIYNETINDLLGKHELDKKKHEIKHDPKTGSTRVTDLTVVPLNSPIQVQALLSSSQSRRSVAATLMNERSSRSHSVFTLRITGTNTGSGEKCEGSLNLVDLAGSERIGVSFGSGSGIEKDRLKETQNINRSLSALGDVIAALGEKGEKGDKHIPYRNSKLTYLLQNSLSGNSKTLMILNMSPLAAHLNESLTSLRFATKVNNTTLGTAKKQSR